MALGFSEIFSIGASILGGGIGGGGMSQTPQAPDINFTRYMRETASPSESEAVRFGESTSYSEFLRAWDSYLNNDYAEMSKRIIK
tara:strand:- start:492 stop:746 length:255 start_codon:yes stop_codon:yes gene_type:complete